MRKRGRHKAELNKVGSELRAGTVKQVFQSPAVFFKPFLKLFSSVLASYQTPQFAKPYLNSVSTHQHLNPECKVLPL